MQEDYAKQLVGIDWMAETTETNSVALLTGNITPSNKVPLMLNTLSELIKTGTESVVIKSLGGKMKMIYILSTKSNTILSKMAGFITDKYTHVSISFEVSVFSNWSAVSPAI